jgi:hypothetical protein
MDRRMALESVHDLDDRSFGKALEQAVKDDALTQGILDELKGRVLEPMAAFWVIFRAGEGWRDAKREVLRQIREEPHRAIMAVEIARQVGLLEWTQEVRPAREGFLALQGVTFRAGAHPEVVLSSGKPALGTTKRAAQALACADWLEAWIENALVPFSDVAWVGAEVASSSRSDEPEAGENQVGLLNEWCQRNQVPAPVYEFEAQGPPHRPEFLARVRVEMGGTTLAAPGIPAASKQDAKHSAACALLRQFDEAGDGQRVQ